MVWVINVEPSVYLKEAMSYITLKANDTDSIPDRGCFNSNHPVEGKQIRYAISIGNEPEQIVDFHTEGRSEEWKLNVLSNPGKTNDFA